jgi:DNA-binding transcriptional ArsR family regulator
MTQISDSLLEEAPLTKLLYLWLEPRGVVQISTQDVADDLGVSKRAVIVGLNRLRRLGLLVDEERGTGSIPHRFRVGVGGSNGTLRLPPALATENASVKLLWLWLRSQRAPSYSVRGLEQRLGLSHRTTYDGLLRLERMGRLERIGQRLRVK